MFVRFSLGGKGCFCGGIHAHPSFPQFVDNGSDVLSSGMKLLGFMGGFQSKEGVLFREGNLLRNFL